MEDPFLGAVIHLHRGGRTADLADFRLAPPHINILVPKCTRLGTKPAVINRTSNLLHDMNPGISDAVLQHSTSRFDPSQ